MLPCTYICFVKWYGLGTGHEKPLLTHAHLTQTWQTITYTCAQPHTNMTNHNLHMHTTSHKHEKPLLGHTHTHTNMRNHSYTHTQKQSPHRYHTNTPTHEKPFLRHTNMRNPYTHTHTHKQSPHRYDTNTPTRCSLGSKSSPYWMAMSTCISTSLMLSSSVGSRGKNRTRL